jgi:hypothetical protein
MSYPTVALLLLVCLLGAPPSAGAQDTQDGQIWVQALALGRLSEHWRSHVEVQPRFVDDASELGLTIIRAAIGRALTPRASLWLGYAWVPRTQGDGVRHEQRVWQQLLLTPPALAGWTPVVRLRLEQRWQNEPWDGTSHRLRTLVRAQRPFRAGSRWQFAAYNELMVTFDETPEGPAQGFDRNRFYTGLMRTLNPAATVEAGYIWEHVAQSSGPNRNDHVAIGVLTLQWPRR